MADQMTRRGALAGMGALALAPGVLAQAPGRMPSDFVWGVAAAAAQTESRDGRGRSNWDVFADTPGKIVDGSTNARCTEFETRYLTDLDLLADAGVKAFRLSIAWPRVQPDGPGAPSAAGLDLYARLIDAMLARGIEPWVTVFHWDTPLWAGDFRDRDMARRLADYAEIVAARLGDRVRRWIMVNEVSTVAINGYALGSHAPGIASPAAAMAAFHHLNLGQGLAFQAMRGRLKGPASLGSSLSLWPVHAVGDSPADALAAANLDALQNRTALDPLVGRPYPDVIAPLVAPFVCEGDAAVMAARPDFLGVNYYSRTYVRAGPGPLGFQPAPAPGGTVATDYFNFEPGGLTEILLRLKSDYGDPALVVTETGFAERDPQPVAGVIDDAARIGHLRAYLEAARTAIAGGARLGGLFTWAATDNWEWQQGFTKHFGLIGVDPATQVRTPKASLAWFGACARANEVV